MLDFSLVSLTQVSVHQIGNKTNGEPLLISKETLTDRDPDLEELLLQYS
jgi:hypothetical protein